MIEKITMGIWTIRFDLESARERHAQAGRLWREIGAGLLLALLRALGGRV